MQKRKLKDYNTFSRADFENAIVLGLNNAGWLPGFFTDEVHGVEHGRDVVKTSRLLVENLTEEETARLVEEGKQFDPQDGYESSLGAIRIMAFLHDCGRFSETGELWPMEQQSDHPAIGAERTKDLCVHLGLTTLAPISFDGISNHEYQNPRITPQYQSAKTLIAKIATSADQLGWFRDDFIERTIAFNQSMGRPFFDPNASTEQRLAWISNTQAADALTVILSQVDYPINPERFGTAYSRDLAKQYQKPLKQRLVETIQKLEPERAPQILDAMRAYEKAVK